MDAKILHLFVAVSALIHFGCGQDVCNLPPASGECPNNADAKPVSRYYYSAANLKCTQFPYYGCGGNGNNFETEALCNEKCDTKLSQVPAVRKIVAAQKDSQCWYKDQTYSSGQQIPKATEDHSCSQGCFCSSFPDGTTPSITCAQVDCAPYPRDTPGCVPIYTDGRCCADYVCPNATDAEAKNTFKCSYGGKDYIEGQRIYDDNYPCISCTCSRKFAGKLTTENGVCKEVNCGLTIHNQLHLLADCTPGYYNNSVGKSSCCPIEWDCATKDSS